MAWIELHQELPRHPKTIRLCAALKIPRPTAIGHLACLWTWAIDFLGKDGDMEDLQSPDIAAAAEWQGDPDQFAAALVKTGWLDLVHPSSDLLNEGARYRIHNWSKYIARLIDQREHWRIKKAEARKRKSEIPFDPELPSDPEVQPNTPEETPMSTKCPPVCLGDNSETKVGLPTLSTGSPASTQPLPNPTQPNPTKPNQTDTTPLPPTGGLGVASLGSGLGGLGGSPKPGRAFRGLERVLKYDLGWSDDECSKLTKWLRTKTPADDPPINDLLFVVPLANALYAGERKDIRNKLTYVLGCKNEPQDAYMHKAKGLLARLEGK